MYITRVQLKNWRNFTDVDVPLRDVTYLVGSNASGKSNFMDVFRFLRDVAKPKGGGLQKAIEDRGGLKKVRCLHSRRDTEIMIRIEISKSLDDPLPLWTYELEIRSESGGLKRAGVTKEVVYREGKEVLNRPDDSDREDPELKTQTALEQLHANRGFRELADFLSNITYLHLVPQLIKFKRLNAPEILEDDPFGQGFLQRIANTTKNTRDKRLTKIGNALSAIAPRFKDLEFHQDDRSRAPHLRIKYEHHRPQGAFQTEDQFSDGTLRLIALFWMLLDGDGFLLLEEPELSLNEEIVCQIPKIINTLNKQSRKKRQILITTHSEALLGNKAIDIRAVLRICMSKTGEASEIHLPSEHEKALMKEGFSPAQVILQKVHSELNQFELGL